jgi:hypothetical protein
MDDYMDDDSDTSATGMKGGMANPAQFQSYLEGLGYPVEKEDLVNKARENGAPEDVMNSLEKLPNMTYNSLINVTEELGKME